MIKVSVPRDISAVKTKVALNLTKRQIICLGAAVLIGMPTYFLARKWLGTEAGALLMMAATLPLFFLAMFERDGLPAEKYLYLVLRQRYLTPGIRRYRQEDAYKKMEEIDRMRKEAERIERRRQDARKTNRKPKCRKTEY